MANYWTLVTQQFVSDLRIYTYLREFPTGTLLHTVTVFSGSVSSSLLFVPVLGLLPAPAPAHQAEVPT